jgi:hypothetical protein
MKKDRWELAFGEGLASQRRSRSTRTGFPRGPPPARGRTPPARYRGREPLWFLIVIMRNVHVSPRRTPAGQCAGRLAAAKLASREFLQPSARACAGACTRPRRYNT